MAAKPKETEARFPLRIDTETYQIISEIAQKKHTSINGLLAALLEDYVEKNKYCLCQEEHTLEKKITKELSRSSSLLVAENLDKESYFDLNETTKRIDFTGQFRPNDNILVFGSTCDGKTLTITSNMVMQSINNNEAVICYDESGDIYRNTHKSLQKAEYDVKTVDLKDPTSPNENKIKLDIRYIVNHLIEKENRYTGDPFFKKMEYLIFNELIESKYYGSISEVIKDIENMQSIDFLSNNLIMNDNKTLQVAMTSLLVIFKSLIPYEDYITLNKGGNFKVDNKKTAIFIIGSYRDAYINTAAVSEMLDTLFDESHNKPLPFKVNCIIDSMSSLGKIEYLVNYIAANRELNIGLNIVFTTIESLKYTCGDYIWEGVLNNSTSVILSMVDCDIVNTFSDEPNTIKTWRRALNGENMVIIPANWRFRDYVIARKVSVFSHPLYIA